MLLLPLTAVAACLAAGRALVDRLGYTPRAVLTAVLTVVAVLLAAGAAFKLVPTPQTLVPRTLVVDQVLRLAEDHGLAKRELNAPPQWLGYLGLSEQTLTVGAASSMFVLFQLVGYGAFLVMLIGVAVVAAPAGHGGLNAEALRERRADLTRLMAVGTATLIIVTAAQRGLVSWPHLGPCGPGE